MELIIDNNILFSLMRPNSITSQIMQIFNLKLYAPLFILKEFEEHEEEIFRKSRLSKEEFEFRKEVIKEKIKFIRLDVYKDLVKTIKIKDQDDIPYMALALKLKIPLWSNDKELKLQDKIKVLNTQEIIMLLE